MQNSKLSAGFTLIETLIVVSFMGIMATIGLPSLYSSLEDARLRGAASEVVTALEYAQLIAMTSGGKTRVMVSPSMDTINVRRHNPPADLFTGGDGLTASSVERDWAWFDYDDMQYPLKKGVDYDLDLKDEDRFQGVDIINSDFNFLAPVYFSASGSPSHGGTVTLVLGSRQMVVSLDVLTGKVSVSE